MPTHSSLLGTGPYLLATLFAVQIPPPDNGPAKSPELRVRRDEILSGEQAKLKELAGRLRSEGKVAEAEKVSARLAEAPATDGSTRFVLLAEVVEKKPKGIDPPGCEAIRLEAAKALFDLAVQASKPPESFALADQCLRGVIERQPDHAEARRLLGFVPHAGGWATPFAADRLAEGSVYDPTYGWVKGDWIPHLRRGELPSRVPNRWLPAGEANALRRDWARKWEISTEHFRIFTNVPLNQAISFGRKLEDLHQLFFALLADVIDPELLPLAQQFKKPGLEATAPNPENSHPIFYFATRGEYARFLAPYQGKGSKTSLGTYAPRKESTQFGGVSYFFNDVGGALDIESTLYHEASHQLLFESAGPDDVSPSSSQYWVFEGLGTYFETLKHEPDGSLRIGGLTGPRIALARRRLIELNEFIPIERLISFNRPQFQGSAGGGDVFLNYAESMALALFLMQADGGRYRQGFLEYVRDVYKGRYKAGSGRGLEAEVGTSYPELNRAFLKYLGQAAKR